VIPTDGAIVPAAVGVDIGCGMIAVRTQHHRDDLGGATRLSELREQIEHVIPPSAGKYNEHVTETAVPRIAELRDTDGIETAARLAPGWPLQLGSLGSGNHFIEVSVDEQQSIWLFLHSGSRGVGNKTAQHHIGVAKNLMARYFIDLPIRIWHTSSRARGSSTPTSAICGGRSTSPCSTGPR